MYESVFDEKEKEELLIKCEYCGKPVEPGEVYEDEIFINGGRRKMKFCSKACACYRQMGAEG